MPATLQRITPFMWFDHQAEEAARFYVSVFENSRIVTVSYYDASSAIAADRAEGSVMTVAFVLDGQKFAALNGGPHFNFNPAMSLLVNCATQQEVDHYWNHLSERGDPQAQQCGWLRDRYGLSWQVLPTRLIDLLNHPDGRIARRASQAMLGMKKIDLAALEDAVAAD